MKEIPLSLNQLDLQVNHFIFLKLIPIPLTSSIITLRLSNLIHQIRHSQGAKNTTKPKS